MWLLLTLFEIRQKSDSNKHVFFTEVFKSLSYPKAYYLAEKTQLSVLLICVILELILVRMLRTSRDEVN